MMGSIQQSSVFESDTGLYWYAVRTFFRREKHVNKLLQLKDLNSWLPLQEKTRVYTRKIRKVQVPLISQYIFVEIQPEERVRVLETEGVIEFIKPSGYVMPIPEHEIKLLKRVIGEDVEIEIEEGKIEKGDLVEIIGGELTGLRGHMVERRGKNRVAINMEHFQHALLMEIPLSALRKI